SALCRQLPPRRPRGLQARSARAGAGAQSDAGVRVPELQPAVADVGAGERRAAAALRGHAGARTARAGQRGAGAGRPGRPGAPPLEPDVGRAAAAGGGGARAGHAPAAHRRRRADGQPRLADDGRDHGVVPGAGRHRDHRPVGHARARRRRLRFARGGDARRARPLGHAAGGPAGGRRSDCGAARRRSAARGLGVIPLETFRVALRALLRNKMRSFLTVLGIIIGVGAVIAMVAIGEGAKAQVEASFASMGSNLLIVLPGSTTSGGARGGFGSMPTLTWDDLGAIQREAPAVRYAAVQLRSSAQLMSDDQNWATQVNGTSPDYFRIRNWKADRGRLLLDSDVESSAKVVVLGQTVVDKLYGAVDPIGQTVRIKNIPFEVVGVVEKKGQSPTGQDYDDCAFVPQTTFMTKIQGGLQKFISGTIFLGATSTEATARAQQQVSDLLRDRHHLDNGADDDFSIHNLTEMANAREEGTRTLTTLLASIAGVSLLVGGIGIMNIMLVSVTERTREIGVRMAVGATPSNILLQFLVEALTLAVAGGMVGVALGVFTAGRLAAKFGWPTLVRPDIVVISVCFSGMVGVVFGLYPARKASQLDPIDALRYE